MKSTIKLRLPLLLSVLLCTLGGYAEELIHPSMLPPAAMSFTTTATGSFEWDLELSTGAMAVIEWTDGTGTHHQSFNPSPGLFRPMINIGGTGTTTVEVYICPDYITEIMAIGKQLTSLDISNLTHLVDVRVHGNQIDGTVSIAASAATLVYLSLADNDIDQIDMGNPQTTAYPLLTDFRVESNEIQQNLDLRNCPELVRCFLSPSNGNANGALSVMDIPDFRIDNLAKLEKLAAVQVGILNGLDLRGCTNLKEIFLNANSIPSLDVAGLAQITRLSARGNQIANGLNLSASKDVLETINCEHNLIPSLDLGTPPYASLRTVSMRYNELTGSLDFSGSPALTGIGISQNPDDNALTGLKAENCPLLDAISANWNAINQPIDFTTCPLLRSIQLQFNDIPSIDVSGLANLEVVTARDNNLTGTIDMFASLGTLRTVSLGNNQLSNVVVNPNSGALQYLGLSNNQIDYLGNGLDLSGCNVLATLSIHTNTNIIDLILPSTSTLTDVSASNCGITQIRSAQSPNSIDGCSGLINLRLQSNAITSFDIEMNSINTLEIVNLFGNQLDATSISNLIDDLHSIGYNATVHAPVRKLFLNNNPNLGSISCDHKKKLNGDYVSTACPPLVGPSLGFDVVNTTNCSPLSNPVPTNYNWCIDVVSGNLL